MNSLKVKVGLASTLFIFVFGCLTAGHFVYKEWNYRMAAVESEIKKSASFLIPQTYLLLKQNDSAALLNYTQVVQSIVDEGNFVYVEIVRSDGKVIVPLETIGRKVHTRSLEKGAWGSIAMGRDYLIHKEHYDDVGSVLEGVFGIVEKNVILGYVVLGVSIKPIYQSLSKSIGGTLILLFVLLVVSGYLSWKFAQKAAAPVSKLTEAVEGYSETDSLDKFEIKGNREVEVLSSKIKNFVSMLKSNEAGLKNALENQANSQRKTEQQIRTILDGFRRLSRSYQLESVVTNICNMARAIVLCRDAFILLSVSMDGDELIPIENLIFEENEIDHQIRVKQEAKDKINFYVYPKSFSKTEFSVIPTDVILGILNKREIEIVPIIKKSIYADKIYNSYQSCVLYPLISGEGNQFGLLFLGRSDENQFDGGEIDTLRSLMEPIGAALENVYLYSQVQKLATCDTMTGLLNRENIRQRLIESLRLTKREQSSVFVVIADIDKFKTFNDSYGHSAGDKVIRSFANILKKTNRLGDYVGRVGGEEFMLVIRNTTMDGARSVVDRIFREVRSIEVPIGEGRRVAYRVSAGIAGYSAENSDLDDVGDTNEGILMDELIENSDKALYESKRNGRDQYIVSTDNYSAKFGMV